MITVDSLYNKLQSCIAGSFSDQVIREKAEIAYEIIRLKHEKNVLLLAHNYIDPAIFHTIPDITGDSLELSRRASETDRDIILVCGVSFMAETAKLLNPEKKVLIPVSHAGCSLAESVSVEDVRTIKKRYPGIPVVAYINTYAELKAEIDVCCTSGNAGRILGSFSDRQIFFIPDEYLGINLSNALGKTINFPDDNLNGEILGWRGHCEVHEKFTIEEVRRIRENHPDAVILAHPECSPDVVNAVDFSGGTTSMIKFIQESNAMEFCLFSEAAMEKNIILNEPRKKFIPVSYHRCPHMEKITLENTLEALQGERYEIEIQENLHDRAAESVNLMLKLI